MARLLSKKYLYLFFLSVVLFSCKSNKPQYYDPYQVNTLSQKLNIPLDNKDKEDDKNIPLYVECSTWIGVPYRYAGNTKKGVDCSGMVKAIYKKTHNKTLSRSTKDQYKESKKTSTKRLKAGDLVFFATGKKKKEPTHVGIYLKDNKFIHASTSKGVIVSSLDESYYKKRFINGRKIK